MSATNQVPQQLNQNAAPQNNAARAPAPIPLQCPVKGCELSFVCAVDVEAHMLAKHNFKCSICSKAFHTQSGLSCHTPHHFTPIRPFCGSCRRCGKPYKVPKCLEEHEQKCGKIIKMPGFDQLPQIPLPAATLMEQVTLNAVVNALAGQQPAEEAPGEEHEDEQPVDAE